MHGVDAAVAAGAAVAVVEEVIVYCSCLAGSGCGLQQRRSRCEEWVGALDITNDILGKDRFLVVNRGGCNRWRVRRRYRDC